MANEVFVIGDGIFEKPDVTEVASGTADAQALPATTDLRLIGFSTKEDAAVAAAAEFILRDGTSVAGKPLAFVRLAADEAESRWFGPEGLPCAAGLFVDRTLGQTHVVVYTKVIE